MSKDRELAKYLMSRRMGIPTADDMEQALASRYKDGADSKQKEIDELKAKCMKVSLSYHELKRENEKMYFKGWSASETHWDEEITKLKAENEELKNGKGYQVQVDSLSKLNDRKY